MLPAALPSCLQPVRNQAAHLVHAMGHCESVLGDTGWGNDWKSMRQVYGVTSAAAVGCQF